MHTVFNGNGRLEFCSKRAMQKTLLFASYLFQSFAFCDYTKTVHPWSGKWLILEMREICGESAITKGCKFAD